MGLEFNFVSKIVTYTCNGITYIPEQAPMSFLIFVGIPLCWAILAKAIAWAVSASCFHSETGKRLGQQLARWCVPIFAGVVLLALIIGCAGNAGHGITLFGSDTLLELLFSIPYYAIPALLAFAGSVYVIRDLTLGHTKSQEVKS